MDLQQKPLLILFIISFIVWFIAGLVIYSTFSLSMSPVNPEYDRYLQIRNSSNCTMMNDTFCRERSGCIHAYESCQIQQCKNQIDTTALGFILLTAPRGN